MRFSRIAAWLAITILACTTSHAGAQTGIPATLLVDDFRTDLHGSGGALPGRSAGRGFPCTWFASFSGTHNIENVASEVRTNTAGYRNYSNRGNGRVIDGNGLSERSLPQLVFGEIWVSFLTRPTASVFDTAQVAFTEGNTAVGCGAPRGFQFGVTPSAGRSFARTCVSGNYCSGGTVSGSLAGPQPYLVIARIVIDTQDSIDVWVNPADLTNGVAGLGPASVSIPASALPSGFAAVTLSTVSVDVANNARIDALRIAYGDTTSDAKLTAVLHGTLSDLPGNGSDFEVVVDVDGVTNPVGTHTAGAGQRVTMVFRSLDLSLACPSLPPCPSAPGTASNLPNPVDGAAFLVAASFGPAPGISFCATPGVIWVDPASFFALAGGVASQANPLFRLSPRGVQLAFDVPPGVGGMSMTLQMLILDASEPCGLGLSDGHRIDFP